MNTKKSVTVAFSPAQQCFTHTTFSTIRGVVTGNFPQHFPWAFSAKTTHVPNEGENGGVR